MNPIIVKNGAKFKHDALCDGCSLVKKVHMYHFTTHSLPVCTYVLYVQQLKVVIRPNGFNYVECGCLRIEPFKIRERRGFQRLKMHS